MMIENAAQRIRAFLNEQGVKVGRVARDAGLSWETVENVKRGRGDPAFSTLDALDRQIPAGYMPDQPPPPGASGPASHAAE